MGWRARATVGGLVCARHGRRSPALTSCATTPSMRLKSTSEAVSLDARISRELKTLSDLFSIAPMLKSLTATMLNKSRSASNIIARAGHVYVGAHGGGAGGA